MVDLGVEVGGIFAEKGEEPLVAAEVFKFNNNNRGPAIDPDRGAPVPEVAFLFQGKQCWLKIKISIQT